MCVHTCEVCLCVGVCEPVCMCVWRLKVDIKNFPWLCFCLVLCGKVSQSNSELARIACLLSCFAPGIPSLCILRLGLQEGHPAHMAFTWILRNLNSHPLAWLARVLTADSPPARHFIFLIDLTKGQMSSVSYLKFEQVSLGNFIWNLIFLILLLL